jgi:hypothetical protein
LSKPFPLKKELLQIIFPPSELDIFVIKRNNGKRENINQKPNMAGARPGKISKNKFFLIIILILYSVSSVPENK